MPPLLEAVEVTLLVELSACVVVCVGLLSVVALVLSVEAPLVDPASGSELVSPPDAPGPLTCHQLNLKPPPVNTRNKSCLP